MINSEASGSDHDNLQQDKHCQQAFPHKLNIPNAVFVVEYALINIRSPNYNSINIDLVSIRICIRIISTMISKQSKRRISKQRDKENQQ